MDDQAKRVTELVQQVADAYEQASALMMAHLEATGFFDAIDELAHKHGDALVAEAEFQAAIGHITPDALDQVRAAIKVTAANCLCDGPHDAHAPDDYLSPEEIADLQAMVDAVARKVIAPPDSDETP